MKAPDGAVISAVIVVSRDLFALGAYDGSISVHDMRRGCKVVSLEGHTMGVSFFSRVCNLSKPVAFYFSIDSFKA